jgi:hypothetical protein
MGWIDLAQDRDQWKVLVNTVMNLRVLEASQEGLIFMELWMLVSEPRAVICLHFTDQLAIYVRSDQIFNHLSNHSAYYTYSPVAFKWRLHSVFLGFV